MIKIATYVDAHFSAVDRLWREVFPDDPERNRALNAIPQKLAMGDDLIWVALGEKGAVIGTIMAGWDGHRGWLYSVAVAPEHRRHRVGTLLVEAALDELERRGCRKVNLQIRPGNETVAGFYRALGFTVEERISMGRTI